MSVEPFSDEELAKMLADDSFGCLPAAGQRLLATVRCLQAERDEARRVARVLATQPYDTCNHGPCHGRCVARQTALAYPEVPHG